MKKLRSLPALTLLVFCAQTLVAQNTGNQYYLGSYRFSSDSNNYHSSIRDYIQQVEPIVPDDTSGKKRSWFHRKLFREHLLQFRKENEYSLNVDFLPDFRVGRSSERGMLWQNTRGVIASGTLGKRLAFKAEFYENQGKFPKYLHDYVYDSRVVPGQGEVKEYNSGKAYDYAYSSALLSYTPSKYLNLQLGYDKNFIGDGYRSMLLSDVSFNYPFAKMTAGAGKLKYMIMWAQFMDMREPKLSFMNGYRKKWGVFHYLDWNVSKKFSIGLFESVIWQDADTAGKRGFDFSYLIPIAFIRPVEFSVGSPDNALMGINLHYSVSPNSKFYGQFFIDEFKLKEITSRNGWWGNKFGGQVGFRAADVLKIPRLNWLSEINAARPFTYAQRNSMLAYTHYNQALAHPLGANFVEWINIADYQYKRWYFRGQLMLARYGLDTAGTNYGKDIFKSYLTRTQEYGNKIGQGLKTNMIYAQGTISYILNPRYNLRLEASAALRREKNDINSRKEFIFNFGLTSSFRQLYYDF